jgi:hypothetical protein
MEGFGKQVNLPLTSNAQCHIIGQRFATVCHLYLTRNVSLFKKYTSGKLWGAAPLRKPTIIWCWVLVSNFLFDRKWKPFVPLPKYAKLECWTAWGGLSTTSPPRSIYHAVLSHC